MGRTIFPLLALTYLTPRQSDPDSSVLRVADAILSAGESSRLYNSLVYTQQLAAEVDAQSDAREDVSLVLHHRHSFGRQEAGRRGKITAGGDQKTSGRAGVGG